MKYTVLKYGMVRDLRKICNFSSGNVKHDSQTKTYSVFCLMMMINITLQVDVKFCYGGTP